MNALATLVVAFLALLLGTDPPAAFQKMLAARNALSVDAKIVALSEESYGPRTRNLVYRRAAGGDFIIQDFGTDEGFTSYDRDGNPQSRRPRGYCRNKDGYWYCALTEPILCHDKVPPEDVSQWGSMPGLHRLGLAPRLDLLENDIDPAEFGPQAAPLWKEETKDGYVIVTAEVGEITRARWTIDPQRGWNPVCVEVFSARTPNEPLWRCTSELQEYEGAWFPARVSYEQNGRQTAEFRVTSAAFNKPEHPKHFSPNDAGAEVGFQVSDYSGEGKMGTWNGSEVMSLQEFWNAERAGKYTVGPTLQRVRRGEASPYLSVEEQAQWRTRRATMKYRMLREAPMSVWERYVKQFIEKHQLSEKPRERAWEILRDCQEQAREHLARCEDELKQLEQEIAKAGEEDDQYELTRVSERMMKLVEPIHRIFEEKLKPRLETLPPRDRRAESPPETP